MLLFLAQKRFPLLGKTFLFQLGHLLVELVVVLKDLRQLVGPNVFVKSLLRELFNKYFTQQQEVEVTTLTYDLQLFMELVLSTRHEVARDRKENQLIDE